MANNIKLQCPDETCSYGFNDIAMLQDLQNLVCVLTTAAEVLTEEHPIWAEMKVLSNIQHRYRRILHCDKSLHLLQRVGSCLRKMVLLDLSKIYLDLAEKLLQAFKNKHIFQSEGNKQKKLLICVPARQQLEFILSRTHLGAKLICQALHYSRSTFTLLVRRLKVGHIVLHLVMATSITARVNILFKGVLLQVFDLYQKLYPWLGKMKASSYEWRNPLDLPEDLEKSLSPDYLELLSPKFLAKGDCQYLTKFLNRTLASNVNKEDDDDDDDVIVLEDSNSPKQNKNKVATENREEDEIAVIDTVAELSDIDNHSESNSNHPVKKVPSKKHASGSHAEEIDIGEVVQRTQPKQKVTAVKGLKLKKAVLLQMIHEANSIKKLKIIWTNIDSSAVQLNRNKIKAIDKMFLLAKTRLQDIKTSGADATQQKTERAILVKLSSVRFLKLLGLSGKKKVKNAAMNIEKVKKMGVKSLKDLKQMYVSLYTLLQDSQQYDKCETLKKLFKRKRSDCKLLKNNGEAVFAKKLIVSAAEEIVAKFC